ncbi:MAG: hypothetical protein O8C63_06900 [Candidatus Methanoperedens sp.]|nr:hypothetical protein [Candidatus Methanoperedens sp.]
MISSPHTSYGILYGFGNYLLVMFFYLGIAVGLHELGHILFAKYHKLEYRILFEKGNIRIAADWEKLGGKKVYGNVLGIVFGFPVVIIAGWIYHTPIFLFVYLISCYDDFGAVVMELQKL